MKQYTDEEAQALYDKYGVWPRGYNPKAKGLSRLREKGLTQQQKSLIRIEEQDKIPGYEGSPQALADSAKAFTATKDPSFESSVAVKAREDKAEEQKKTSQQKKASGTDIGSAKERSAARLMIQNFIPGSPFAGAQYPGSAMARQDSLNLEYPVSGETDEDKKSNLEILKEYAQGFTALPREVSTADSAVFREAEHVYADSAQATLDANKMGIDVNQLRKANREARDYYNSEMAKALAQVSAQMKEKGYPDVSEMYSGMEGESGEIQQEVQRKKQTMYGMVLKQAEAIAAKKLLEKYNITPQDIVDY